MSDVYSICIDCKHGGRNPDDSYHCPWAWNGRYVVDWLREGRRVVRCPHFCEEGKWSLGVRYGKWRDLPPIPYVDCAKNGRRIVCLNINKMFESQSAATEWLMSLGKSNMKSVRDAGNFAKVAKNYEGRAKYFRAYGLTWSVVEDDPRRATRKSKGKKNAD